MQTRSAESAFLEWLHALQRASPVCTLHGVWTVSRSLTFTGLVLLAIGACVDLELASPTSRGRAVADGMTQASDDGGEPVLSGGDGGNGGNYQVGMTTGGSIGPNNSDLDAAIVVLDSDATDASKEAGAAACESPNGECLADAGAFQLEPTQGCPLPGSALPEARADLDEPFVDCWIGDSWETATAAFGRGELQTGPEGGDSRVVSAYAFSNEWSLKTQAYDAAGVLLRGCVAVDNQADQTWVRMTFNHDTCKGAAFVRVTAHASSNGDL